MLNVESLFKALGIDTNITELHYTSAITNLTYIPPLRNIWQARTVL